MGDFLIMRKNELQRKTLLEGVRHKKLTLKECATRLDISYRQIKRIWGQYQRESDQGLCHKNRGKQPHNAYSNEFRSKILNLYQQKYLEFGPTFAAEKMQEDNNTVVNPETLRLWLKAGGLWTKKRKRVMYRERRDRRPCFGDLLQIDGSIHQWFSDERYDCLLNMVDDATGITFALLDTGETTKILLTCLKKWIEKYGVPKSVYVDLKSVYVSSKYLKDKFDDELQDGFSVFQQVCKELNIQIIKAYSPQAKGRVERKHRVFQDRFLKSLKLYGIKTIEAANEYLENKFLHEINGKFSVMPKDMTDGHRDRTLYGDLNEIICWNYTRQLKNDWSIRFKNEYFQLREPEEKDLLRPGEFVTLKKYLNGSIKFWYGSTTLKHGTLSRKPEPPSRYKKYYVPSEGIEPYIRSMISTQNKRNSPWNQFNPAWLKSKKPIIGKQKSAS